MESIRTSLRRSLATALTVFMSVGLGLIGPASALAQGVERGLNFTIISDDINKAASGSVPAVAARSGSEEPTVGEGEAVPTGDGSRTTVAASSIDSSTTTSGSGTTDGSTSPGNGGGPNYNTSKEFDSKNETNKAGGKSKYSR